MSSLSSAQSARAAAGGLPKVAPVRAWLFAIAGLILLMTLVGGATRLTESGLSITQWKPVTGILPPMSAADWQTEFDGYQQIPQFRIMRPDMTLGEFQAIFWWEWGHRLLARLIGLAFIAPALWFWARGQFRGAVGRWVLVATGLLALEPIVGWWMVASGLVDRVEVAPQRLAMHLLIAAATFGALLAAAASSLGAERAKRSRASIGAGVLALLLFVQLGLGALAAGLRAGLLDNTWPLMEGRLIPASAFRGSNPLAAMIGDPATAQLDHRTLAYVVVLTAVALAIAAFRRSPPDAAARWRAMGLAALALAQAALGIMTLLFQVPIALGLAHQALALALYGAAVWNWRIGAT